MKWRSICSVTSKSAMTPSLSGHPLGLDSDRVHGAGTGVDRHHRRLGEHDPAPAHVDEGVRRPKVDRHVAAAESGQVAENAHTGGFVGTL
jgi:hypothetical protein